MQNIFSNYIQSISSKISYRVPESAWSFGYKPAQKWLKDRKGKKLTNEDIENYQKIIVALTETDRLMNLISSMEGGQNV